ncbi:hypothetical protein L1887_56231 [Cichorium endivia]|nr:hypothetical protein L1887_56231 [Cichorium endivia]
MAKTPARHTCPPNRRLAAQSGGPPLVRRGPVLSECQIHVFSCLATAARLTSPNFNSPRIVLAPAPSAIAVDEASKGKGKNERHSYATRERLRHSRSRTRRSKAARRVGHPLRRSTAYTPSFFSLFRLARICHAAPAMQGRKAFFFSLDLLGQWTGSLGRCRSSRDAILLLAHALVALHSTRSMGAPTSASASGCSHSCLCLGWLLECTATLQLDAKARDRKIEKRRAQGGRSGAARNGQIIVYRSRSARLRSGERTGAKLLVRV